MVVFLTDMGKRVKEEEVLRKNPEFHFTYCIFRCLLNYPFLFYLRTDSGLTCF